MFADAIFKGRGNLFMVPRLLDDGYKLTGRDFTEIDDTDGMPTFQMSDVAFRRVTGEQAETGYYALTIPALCKEDKVRDVLCLSFTSDMSGDFREAFAQWAYNTHTAFRKFVRINCDTGHPTTADILKMYWKYRTYYPYAFDKEFSVGQSCVLPRGREVS